MTAPKPPPMTATQRVAAAQRRRLAEGGRWLRVLLTDPDAILALRQLAAEPGGMTAGITRLLRATHKRGS